jgi:parallel beta-helix repeat protein
MYSNGQWTDISKNPATVTIAPANSGYSADVYTTGTTDDVIIQAALNSISKGIVLCKIGDYQITAKLKIPTDVYLVGEGMKTRFIATSALADHMIINKNASDSNVQIRDIYLDCTATTSGNGTVISLSSVTDGKIFNVETNGGIGAGIVIASCTRTNVIRTTSHHSKWSGIWIQQSNVDCTVDQCITYSNGQGGVGQPAGHGIEIGNLTNNNNSFCRISNNISHDNENGIRFYGFGQHHIDIIGNICYNNGVTTPAIDGNGISESTGNTSGTIACHDINITGNNCYNNGDSGISVATSSSGTPAAYGYNITGNTCTNNGNCGIQSVNVIQSLISGNVCSYNGKQGIYAVSSLQGTNITGNSVFYNQTHGIEVLKFSFGSISNNVLYGNGQLADNTYMDILLNDDGTTFSTNNVVSGNNAANFLTNRTQAAIREQSSGDNNNLIINNIYAGQRGTELIIQGANTKQANNFHAGTTEALVNSGFTAKSAITLSAGTTTNAPLIFVSGTNLTTASAGAMEFDGSSFYLTPSTTRKTIGYSDMSNLVPVANFSMSSNKIINLTDPTNPQDAATKNYVDSVAQGLSVKPSAIVATTTGLPTYTYANGTSGVGATITMTATGTVTIDGHVLALNDIVLVMNETSTNAPYNGLYSVTTAGATGVACILTRHIDMDQASEFDGAFVFVESGTVNVSAGFVCNTTGTVTIGTTNVSFTQFSGAGEITVGTGLVKSGNQLSIDTSWVGQSAITTVGTISTGTWSATTIAVNKGGTGQTSYTDGQLLIGNTTGNTLALSTLTAGNNVTVTNGHGSITLDTIQDIRTTASPTFAGLNLGTGNISTLGNVSIDGSAARNITVAQSTTTTGQNLTIAAGSSVTGNNNEIGGALILKAGLGTGNNGNSVIIFQSGNATGSGSTTQTLGEKGRFANSTNGRFIIGDASGGVSGGGDGLNLMGTVQRFVIVVRNTTASTGGQNLTIQAGGATSATTDKVGGNLILAPGISTGLGRSYVTVQGLTPAASTGTGDNSTYLDRQIVGAFKALTNNSATNLVNCTLASNTICGGIIKYAVEVFDGTNLQMEVGAIMFEAANKGGSFSGNTMTQLGSAKQFLGSGTLSMTWAISAANPAVISLNANSSLTPNTGYPRITYTIENFTQQAIAIQ